MRISDWSSDVCSSDLPVADVVYYGVTFGIQAAQDGLVQAYRPQHWDQIPAGMKDPDGKWFAIHSGALGLMVNVDALGGKPVPRSWADLLQPESPGMGMGWAWGGGRSGREGKRA